MRLAFPGYITGSTMFVCVIMTLMQVCTYSSCSVWHGGVKPSHIEAKGERAALYFTYSSGKNGYTTDSKSVALFAAGKLTRLWCDVARDGSATCYPPEESK